MKTLRFSLSCLFCLFFVIEGIWGQKYVRLEDASGYTPTAEQLSSLELAADSLCAAFDSAGFPGQFKVYDFGFYLHQDLQKADTRSRLHKKSNKCRTRHRIICCLGSKRIRVGCIRGFG